MSEVQDTNVVETENNEATSQQVTSSPVESRSSNEIVESKPAETDSKLQASEVQEWKPSHKYKVLDKELEFDEHLKKVVTTKEAEEKIKELYEKASGIEEIKTKRDKVQVERDEWKGKYAAVETSLKSLGEHVRKKDYRSFFENLQIPRADIMNYVMEELKLEEMPAEERQRLEDSRRLQQEYTQMTRYNQTLEQQVGEVVRKQYETELNFELSKPEISNIINSFDARAGKPGAFRSEVINRGIFYEKTLGQSPQVGQVVGEVLNLIGANFATQQGANFSSGTQPSQAQVQQQAEKPVITAFGSGSSGKSPVRKVAQSLEDLQRLRTERQAQA